MYYITITNHNKLPELDIEHKYAPKLKIVACTGDIVILPGMSITMTATGTIFIRGD
jgi:hypothetical protein